MGLGETGILVSCTDYHIFLKLKKTRKQALDQYLNIIRAALDAGITPRCHFEDITRADFYGFVVPFAIELMKLREQYGRDVKIRLCDTLGFGVPWPPTVGKIIMHFAKHTKYASEQTCKHPSFGCRMPNLRS